MGTISAAEFEVHSIVHTLMGYTIGKMVFGWDIITLITYISNWKLIYHFWKAQINYDNERKNTGREDYYYQVVDKITIRNNEA